VGHWELKSALAAAAADEDELGGSARSSSCRANSPAPRAGGETQDAPRGGRDAQNDETAQSEMDRKQKKILLEIDCSDDSKNSRRIFLPLGRTL